MRVIIRPGKTLHILAEQPHSAGHKAHTSPLEAISPFTSTKALYVLLPQVYEAHENIYSCGQPKPTSRKFRNEYQATALQM